MVQVVLVREIQVVILHFLPGGWLSWYGIVVECHPHLLFDRASNATSINTVAISYFCLLALGQTSFVTSFTSQLLLTSISILYDLSERIHLQRHCPSSLRGTGHAISRCTNCSFPGSSVSIISEPRGRISRNCTTQSRSSAQQQPNWLLIRYGFLPVIIRLPQQG